MRKQQKNWVCHWRTIITNINSQKNNMSEFSERRYVMHKDFVPPVSIEEFAAYLDGNLSENGMNRIDALAAMNHDMEEMITLSDKIDEDVIVYMQDDFAYEADMTALENSDFDIPDLDVDITPHIGTDTKDDAVDETTDIVESTTLNDNNETVPEMLENDDFLTYQDEDSISTNSDNHEDDVQEHSIFPLEEDF